MSVILCSHLREQKPQEGKGLEGRHRVVRGALEGVEGV